MDNNSTDYRFDPVAYEIEEKSRPDEMAMLTRLGEECYAFLNTLENAFVVDLCCGTGLSMQDIVDHPNVLKVIGVDDCMEYLDFAENKFRDNPKVEFIYHDAVTVDLPEKKWDMVILSSAYHHIRDEHKLTFMKKVNRLLSNRGRVLLAENILPNYEVGNTESYNNAVSLFYTEVLKTAVEENLDLTEQVKGLIWKVAEYGFAGDYEYKTSFTVFLDYLVKSDLTIVNQERVWPKKGPLLETPAGNYVIQLKKYEY